MEALSTQRVRVQIHAILYHAFMLHGRSLGRNDRDGDVVAKSVTLTDEGIVLEVDMGDQESRRWLVSVTRRP